MADQSESEEAALTRITKIRSIKRAVVEDCFQISPEELRDAEDFNKDPEDLPMVMKMTIFEQETD